VRTAIVLLALVSGGLEIFSGCRAAAKPHPMPLPPARVTLWQNSNTLFQYSPAPATLAQMGFKQVIVPLVGWDPWAAKPSSGMTALQYAQKARQLTAGLPLWLGTSVTHRQANAALPPHMVPWIDDAAWSVSLKNLTELCKAAEAVGAVGIAID